MRNSFKNFHFNRFLVSATIAILISFNLFSSSLSCTIENPPDKKGTRTIYLIRHGQYDHDDPRSSEVGKELIPLGIAQTRLLADRLKSMPVKMNSLLSSTLTRARQTAMIINEEFPELDLQQSGLIRECTPPTWRKDVMSETSTEELKECTKNLDEAFKKFFVPSPDENDRHDMIVCHGNVIRYFVTKILKVDTQSWLQMTTGNCGLTVVHIRSD